MKKTFNKVRTTWCVLVLVASLVFAASLYAQSSSRDASVDAVLIGAEGMGTGALPATGSQGVLSPGSFLPVIQQPNTRGLSDITTPNLLGVSGAGFSDKKANIYEFSGEVKVRPAGESQWQPPFLGMMIQQGTEILTGAGSYVSITFDANYANVAYIPENTKAEFRSIEPTDIFLVDGTIYNILDGLKNGAEWKVSTPTIVSAVRGTWFLVSFTMADGTTVSATIDVPDDGSSSSIQVSELLNGSQTPSVTIPEGNQISLKEGESPDPSLITNIDQKWLLQILEFLARLGEYRAQNAGELPPTGSDFFDPPSEGAGGETLEADQTGGIGDEPSADVPPSDDDQFRGDGDGDGDGDDEYGNES